MDKLPLVLKVSKLGVLYVMSGAVAVKFSRVPVSTVMVARIFTMGLLFRRR